METITKSIGAGRQDVVYTEVLHAGDHKLRVSIRSDAYAFQSWATVKRWDGDKWHLVHSIHHSQMKTPHSMYVGPTPTDRSFRADRDELLRVASAILDIEAAA